MGVDLFEVREWPVAKKLVYGEHMMAEQMAQEEAHGDVGDFDYDGMNTPSNVPTPQGASSAPSPGSLPGKSKPNLDPTGSKGFTTPSGREVHPALAGYDNIIHVEGDEDES